MRHSVVMGEIDFISIQVTLQDVTSQNENVRCTCISTRNLKYH